MSSFTELTQNIRFNLAPLRKDLPDVMTAFSTMGKAAIAPGALDSKTKELIALAIGVANRCDGCIGFHSQALVSLGASMEEVQEALGVAMYMGGGPSVMYAANAVRAFQEFSDKAAG